VPAGTPTRAPTKDPSIRLRHVVHCRQFLEFDSETWNMSSEAVDPGVTHFGSCKTDAREPNWTFVQKAGAREKGLKERACL